jgi:hypothetical protein
LRFGIVHNQGRRRANLNAVKPRPQHSGSGALEERFRAANVSAAAYLEPRMLGIVKDVGELLAERVPGYGPEALHTVGENITVIFEIALERLHRGEAPEEADADAIAVPARRWAAEGRPLDPRAFQLGARHVMAAVAARAADLGIDDRSLFEMQDRVWAWATACASILADAHRDHDVALARRDATVRADLLRDLAAGRVTADRLARESKALGLDLGEPYFAVCAVCDSGAADALEAHIRRSGATAERRTLQAVIDGRLLAVTARVPAAYEDVAIAIAIGPAALLSDAHTSFAEADQALATARAFGVGGVVHLGALGPLPLVNEAPALAARLGDRHLRELERRGASGREIEETVRILLELDRNVEATAARLHLHRNSIRYRVSRFHELTGLDLGRTEDLVTTWWLLSRRRATGS